MSIPLPKFDPYAVLGVEKDGSLSDIRSAYRKLVLKCHPDKIKDESLRSNAQDEFQRVQEAYELLSDDTSRTRYDNESRLAALRKEAMGRAAANGEPSPYSTSRVREYRDGRVYEERTPAGASYVDDDDDIPFTEEPRAYSRKYDDYGKRSHTKVTEEKKKAKSIPIVTPRKARENVRENVKASHHDRAKNRTKERRREFSDKFERTAYVVTDDESSGPDIPTAYAKEKRPSEPRRTREPPPRRSKTEPLSSSRKSESRRYRRGEDDDEDGFSDEWESLDNLQSSVREYINVMRAKSDPPIESRCPRLSRSPPTYTGYESSDRFEREASRYSSRGHVRVESARAAAVSPPRTHQRRSSERLDPERKVPSMPIAASSPKVSSSSRHPPTLRSTTAPYPRSSRREGSRSGEFDRTDRLSSMVSEGVSPRTKLRPSDRYDSGYSSPGTPEMPQGSGSGSAKVNRYKIVDPPETIVVEPSEPHHRYHRSTSPLRPERPNLTSSRRGSAAATTTTYTYSPDAGVRYETVRPSTSSRPPLSRVYDDVRYAKPIKAENIQYGYPRYSKRQPAY